MNHTRLPFKVNIKQFRAEVELLKSKSKNIKTMTEFLITIGGCVFLASFGVCLPINRPTKNVIPLLNSKDFWDRLLELYESQEYVYICTVSIAFKEIWRREPKQLIKLAKQFLNQNRIKYSSFKIGGSRSGPIFISYYNSIPMFSKEWHNAHRQIRLDFIKYQIERLK